MMLLRPITRFSLLCILPALAIASSASSSLDSHRLLQSTDVLSHIQSEHSKGNSHPSFTLSLNNIEVEVIQSNNAILPSTRYSIHDRTTRQVGHLGYYHLVSKREGEFVLLNVNREDGEVNGIVKQFDGEWITVNNGLVDDRKRDLRIPRYSDALPDRQLQAFHSDYFYQIDLHLDIDYELVKINGGSLCNVFNYINALITAANVVLEREVMTHINVKYIRQTDFYDDVYSTFDALDKMKREMTEVQWHIEGIDLHYALLGKELSGGLGNRSGVGFIEDSLCDSSKGFGVVSGLEGGFDDLDERLGSDLKRFMYAIG
jgi:hypothetical protein